MPYRIIYTNMAGEEQEPKTFPFPTPAKRANYVLTREQHKQVVEFMRGDVDYKSGGFVEESNPM